MKAKENSFQHLFLFKIYIIMSKRTHEKKDVNHFYKFKFYNFIFKRKKKMYTSNLTSFTEAMWSIT